MSKIDDYVKAKARAESLRGFADSVSDPRSADKFGMRIKVEETWLGFYGRSSVYSWHDAQVVEVMHQIKLDLRSIVERAAQRVEAESENARKAAADEAREVLGKTEA